MTGYRLEKPTIMLRSVPQMLKRWRIIVNRISKVRQTTCNWIKKILDEATRIVNVFLIPWFFYLFLLCSISLLVKYDFILRYCGSFIENFSQISANQSLSSEICSESSHEIGRSLQSFFSETGLENSREIPAKSTVFSANLSLKIRRNLTFFRDLPEALTC